MCINDKMKEGLNILLFLCEEDEKNHLLIIIYLNNN